MKRTGSLARRTPLVAKTPLARTGSAPKHTRTASKPKRRPAGIPLQVRTGLKARSGGMCEIAAPGCDGRATDASHRLGVKMGGRQGTAAARHHVLSQLLHSCRGCHELLHSAPAAAYWQGWMLRENEDPTAVPVLYRGQWVRLTNDGSIEPTNDFPEEN